MYRRIGLDIDGVLRNYVKSFLELAKKSNYANVHPDRPEDVKNWYINNLDRKEIWWHIIEPVNESEEFWGNIEPLKTKVPFQPVCYITHSPMDSKFQHDWLVKNGFPSAEVVVVKNAKDKIKHYKTNRLDLFVDDHIDNIKNIIYNGGNGVLFDSPYSRYINHGLQVIKDLDEINIG